MKRVLVWLVPVAILTAVLVVGLSQAGSDDDPAATAPPYDLQAGLAQLEGAPAPLAALHAQSAELLDGGLPAFERRLAGLEGTPVVINKWASWCHPCKAEFPIFQEVATKRGKEIAFLGVNGTDSTDPARKFLTANPVPYPSYVDPDEEIARAIKAAKNYPITVFLDAQGRSTIKQGVYESAADLEADIDRYAAA